MPNGGTAYLIDDFGRIYTPSPDGARWQRTDRTDHVAKRFLDELKMEAARSSLLVRPAASDDAQRALYYDPRGDPRPEQDRVLPILALPGPPERSGGGATAFVVLTVLALVAVAIVLFVKFGGGSDAPGNITASPLGKYRIKVTWTNNLKGATGFRIDNGCPVGACGGHGATLAKTTRQATSAIFRVTPGTYQCFRVQAFRKGTESGWSGYGCASTPSLNVHATRAWRPTRVMLKAGDRLYVKAAGQISIGSSSLVSPSGHRSCTPAADHPASAASYPAPRLPCLSLIGRIGHHKPFEIGNSVSLVTPRGRLYIGVNGSRFAGSSGSWTVNIKLGGAPPAP